MYFDTHAHLDDARFDGDREALLERMRAEGIDPCMTVGANMEMNEKAVALAQRYPGTLYAAVGIHPNDALELTEEALGCLRAWAKLPCVKAWGEIGLDYHYDDVPREVQKEAFLRQLDEAMAADLPVILHIREAHGEAMELMQRRHKAGTLPRGIMHCFSGSWELAKVYLSFGYYISLSGVVTFKNANKLLDVAKNVPLDRLLVETDCPYMAPVPMRGQRNEPSFVQYTFARVAELRGEDPETLAEQLWENAVRANS